VPFVISLEDEGGRRRLGRLARSVVLRSSARTAVQSAFWLRVKMAQWVKISVCFTTLMQLVPTCQT
jgi:hypothetical protein